MSKVNPVLSAFLCFTLILVCNLSMTYADPTTNNASAIFIKETIGTQENEFQNSITAVEAEEDFIQPSDTSDQETESNSVSDSDTVETTSSPNQSDNSIDGFLSTPAYDVSTFSLTSDVRSIDELDSLSLSLEYDDHYSIEKLEDNYSVAYIYNQSATSYQVSKGKKGNLDTSVIEKDGSSNKDIVATGVGTATLLLVPDSQINNVKSTINNIGSTEEAYILETLADKYYSQSFSNWLTVEVDVEPADLTLIYVAGQSNAEGWCSSSTGYQVQDSVLCEEGTVYSTYVPNDISKGSQIAGLDFSSADTNGNNASKFVAGSLTGETSISGNNLQYPLNSLTEAGDGKTGPDSGIAFQWNRLTGDKVWVVNAAWGGTSITKWVPGATCYKRANTIFDLATQTFDAEISSGHYKEASILMFWVQGEADADMDAGTYTSYFNTMYEKWMDSYDLDGFGIIMVRAAAGSHTTAADLKMTGPRIALYSIGRSDDYPNVFVVSNANEEWVSNSGVSSYFSSEYTGGTLSYPTHRSTSQKIPTTVSEVHSDIHYSQIGHNENGITAAKGMYNALFQASSNITSAWKDQDYHTITSILMEEGDQVTVIPVAEPAYQAKKLRISVSGSAVKYDSETGLVSGVNLGSAKLQIKTSTGKVLSTLDVSVTEIPKISSIDNNNTGVTIKWHTVSDAKNYTIYRHSGDGDLTEIATTSLTSYTDKTVKNGNTYYYRVGYTSNTGAEVSGVSSSYDKSITFLSSPELNAAYGENGGIVFNWKSVTGASEYRIYRKTGSTGWALIGTSSSNSYKDSTAKIGSIRYEL